MSTAQPAAVRMRHHREELQLALREGMTLEQARQQLESYRAHRTRLEAGAIGAPAPKIEWPLPDPPEALAERPTMWWQRD